MRLIDADALKNALIECTPYAIDPVYRNTNSNIDMFTAMEILDELPTIDTESVVRCMDCVKRGTPECAMWYKCEQCGGQWSWETNNDYCSYGAKMDKED